MDELNATTKRVKGQHLAYEDRVLIQTRLKDGWKANRIAREIGCAPNTVRNEIRRGMTPLYNGSVFRYRAITGQDIYESNRRSCCRTYAVIEKSRFIKYVEQHFFKDYWSLDACVGRALLEGRFTREQIVCTKTLYNYVSTGMIGIKSIDLPDKPRRSPKKARITKNRRILGCSIEERPREVDDRNEFGHWEADLVIGSKSGDNALLTMIERKTRKYWAIRIPKRDSGSVMRAFETLRLKYGKHWNDIFKTITTDNGFEFSLLSNLENLSETLVYFTHPYSSYEKGSVERHNGLIRRFIPKKQRIDGYSIEQILWVENWCNTLPRKLLNYRTPDEVFKDELDNIYSCS